MRRRARRPTAQRFLRKAPRDGGKGSRMMRSRIWVSVLAVGALGALLMPASNSYADGPAAPAAPACKMGDEAGCKTKCDAKDQAACVILGNTYAYGYKGVKKDGAKAMSIL